MKEVRKKKILIRIGSLRHGGAEKTLINFLKNIPPNKYEIDLLLNLRSGKYLSEVPSWIKVYHLNKGEMITTNSLRKLPEKLYRVTYQWILRKYPALLYKFILKEDSYDVEFVANHNLLEEVLNSPVKQSKKIVWIHNDLFSIPSFNKERIKNFFNADKILVISDKIKQGFKDLAQTEKDSSKIIKIYNPIDSDEFIERSEEKISFDFSQFQEKTFLAVGTVFPQKGFDRLLKVHKRLLEEGYKHEVVIVGDGYDYNNINNLLKSLNLEKTAHMVGFQENPYPFFKNLNYFILSSRYEGYPTVLFEALALKKPIVATQVSGVDEILQGGRLGKIVENSEEGIYKGMKEFLTNEELPQSYLKNMKEEELPFTLEKSINLLMKIIDEV